MSFGVNQRCVILGLRSNKFSSALGFPKGDFRFLLAITRICYEKLRILGINCGVLWFPMFICFISSFVAGKCRLRLCRIIVLGG